MKRCINIIAIFSVLCVGAQNYTSYLTGSPSDISTNPSGGICLMGGATENDSAMKWFVERANGGDVLVLRATGSNGYNSYLYSSLGVTLNSVETIVCHNSAASSDPYVQQRVAGAEAIWFAGGDQWDYISYWRNTAIDSIINQNLQTKKIVIGGISAGMAIQGKYYFTAQNGSVTSGTALANPYANTVTVDSTGFIKNKFLEDVITDTHYDNPDRKGRHVTFLARIYQDYGVPGKGIACDEYAAVCIDTNGIAYAYGDYPTYNDFVYFLQPNCALSNPAPEDCSPGNTLQWLHNGTALKVYKIGATSDGAAYFSLNDWSTASGGSWQDWSTSMSNLIESPSNAPNCLTTSLTENSVENIQAYPNPANDRLRLSEKIEMACVKSLEGRTILTFSNTDELDLRDVASGVYLLELINSGHKTSLRFVRM